MISKLLLRKLRFVGIGVLFCLLPSLPTVAQIVPDATLPNNSSVTSEGNTSNINGGTEAGSNLFHSFERFSVPTGSGAYFNNALEIQNIISRVTGSSASNIDGFIKANGTANLFLINPNGIIFGSNASLNIGGSFVGSTANSLNFADGTHFSATTPQTKPLLTISVPFGLQFGENSPSAIRVQGTGHTLSIPIPIFLPILGAGVSSDGLRVMPGKTLALVGGNIDLEGGKLTAPGGYIGLGSISFGIVNLNPTSTGWTLGYGGVQNFQDIGLSQQALIDASGTPGGFIQVQGNNVTLTDGSMVLTQNQGVQPSGSLSVNAAGTLKLIGAAPGTGFTSSLFNETVGAGNGGDITISTNQLFLQDGGAVTTKTFTRARAGNLFINASDSAQIIGYSFIDPSNVSGISTFTLNSGEAGNIRLSTGQLTALNGGTVLSTTFGTGEGGNVDLDVSQVVKVIGVNPFSQQPSILSTSTLNAGNGGALMIDTSGLVLKDGGVISSSTLATGNAGATIINASKSIEISNFSNIVSAATGAPLALQQLLSLPPVASGVAGDLTIHTGQLHLTNKGLLGVNNQGIGDAGIIRVSADSISLDNESAITASTTFGERGNIQLKAKNLQLRHNSLITATAGNIDNDNNLRELFAGSTGNNSLLTIVPVGTGRGGNININTETFVILEDSNISSSAYGGTGGRVSIDTQGFFSSPDSTITATSKAGPQFNGTVQINTLTTDLSYGLAASPLVPVDVTGLIAQGCQGSGGTVGKGASDFTIAGRGGLPPQPGEPLRAAAVVGNVDTLKAEGEDRSAAVSATPPTHSSPAQLVEAQGWVLNAKGEVVFTAQPPSATPYSASSTQATCYAP